MALAFAAFRTAFARFKAAIAHHRDCMRAEQIRRARFEAEMYQGLYRHSSKNDDDLPIAPRAWAARAVAPQAGEPNA